MIGTFDLSPRISPRTAALIRLRRLCRRHARGSKRRYVACLEYAYQHHVISHDELVVLAHDPPIDPDPVVPPDPVPPVPVDPLPPDPIPPDPPIPVDPPIFCDGPRDPKPECQGAAGGGAMGPIVAAIVYTSAGRG